jgi:tRNA A37 threonylcarbamoyladenosine dehydratase
MKACQKNTTLSDRGKHVALIGLGTIGSPLAELLTRMDAVKRLTLVDCDVYEEQNLRGQAIRRDDVGRPGSGSRPSA